jgi:hypothetical protein
MHPTRFNEHMQDVVLVALTSNLSGDDQIEIEPPDCVDGILPKLSAVKPTKVFTIHSDLVVRKICAVRPERLGDRIAHACCGFRLVPIPHATLLWTLSRRP